MNRAQRRSAGNHILNLLDRKRVDYLTEQDVVNLLLPVRMNIRLLMQGRMSDQQFVDLNEANIACWCIGQQLARYRGNAQETGEIALRVKELTENLAETLAAIGTRKHGGKTRGYVAKAEELDQLDEMANWYEQLLPNVPRGALNEALAGARQMVNEELIGVHLENLAA